MSYQNTQDVEDGFVCVTTWENSTVQCPCGSTFTWEGYDKRLFEWQDKHRPHLGGTNEQKEAG